MNNSPIRIVTDSACDVPASLAEQLGIIVVPVYVNIGQESYLDGVELTREEFYQNLPQYDPYPTTAAPSSGSLAAVYQQLADEGATDIISIHIASSLSATCQAAHLGAESVNGARVHVFDSQQITLGGGLLALTAAELVAAGHSVNEILVRLEQLRPHTRVFGMLDTLDSLRRSGRVSWAQFGFGTLLQIKPIMVVHEGEVTVAARVRTRSRSQQTMLAMVEDLAPFERLAVIHAAAPEAAADLQTKAQHLIPAGQEIPITAITPAIGAHLGLGAVGFACIAGDHGSAA
jgi:DegV family protein with EDD domain